MKTLGTLTITVTDEGVRHYVIKLKQEDEVTLLKIKTDPVIRTLDVGEYIITVNFDYIKK